MTPSTPTGPSGGSLRARAAERAVLARSKKDDAMQMALRHQWWHYRLGIPGAIAVPVSTASFLVEQVPAAASWSTLVAGVVTSLAGFLGEGALAKHHWRRHACMEGLIQKFENAAEGPDEPTTDRMDELATEWTECTEGPTPSELQ